MAWKFNSQIPVSIQIASKLRSDIVRGKYSPGDQFPTVRQLAYEASVNPNTMQKALSTLESEGLLISRGTIGRFVTSEDDILEGARDTIKKEFINEILIRAGEMGIPKDELVRFIKESEEKL